MIGLDLFASTFAGLEEQYVLIGGAAAELWFQRAGLEFRATQDQGLVLSVGALGAEFVQRFWTFVDDGGYEVRERGDGTPIKYRFSVPTRPEFPKQLELFASAPIRCARGAGDAAEEQVVAPIAVDDELSSLSAVLLDEAYREVVLGCRAQVQGVMCLTPQGLVLLKARAWLDHMERVASGTGGAKREAKKHRNDVFRIAGLLGEGEDPGVPETVLADLARFVEELETRTDEWPAIAAACGSLPLNEPGELLEVLRSHFGLESRSA